MAGQLFDPQSAFRSNEFEEWSQSQGIELMPCPAEDHGQIGLAETLIGKLRKDIEKLLSSYPDLTAASAAMQMMTAHNELDRVAGYSPLQWSCGRQPTFDNRYFDGIENEPLHSAEACPSSDFQELAGQTRGGEDLRKVLCRRTTSPCTSFSWTNGSKLPT